ncbi:hypothetical protein [Domibacillus aminovorans]|uniref:Uncharacterized protein n=1 Tax=Domibacillus aminovorans TaxID=29332 RepID=A0A177L1V0_9BACI|nr:hypothetical protein [Domibacillus aminovorans]OAH59374.1 hypothetical protein AWH49_18585 [Domibacillus aminovorans]
MRLTPKQQKFADYYSVPIEVLENAIQHNFTSLTLNERLQAQRNEVILKLRQVVTSGLYEGQTYRTMARSIQDHMEMSATKAIRIVRTESKRRYYFVVDYYEEKRKKRTSYVFV